MRLQKSWTRSDFSDTLINSFHISDMYFCIFTMSTVIQKSCFPLKFWSKAVVSVYSKSCTVADCELLVLIHGRQLKKALLDMFKPKVLYMHAYRRVPAHTYFTCWIIFPKSKSCFMVSKILKSNLRNTLCVKKLQMLFM